MIAFVILHYLAVESTITCVKCIKSLGQDVHIVVVDNASPDGSGLRLARKYKKDRRVTMILNKENAGFARGNNLGVEYAQKHLNPEFTVVLNDDVEIQQPDFCRRIRDIYNNRAFDVLGPDIISQFSGVHQSPKSLKGYDLDRVRAKAAYVRRSQHPVIMYLGCGEKCSDFIWRRVQRYRRDKSGIDFAAPAEGVVLHGSCVIFSRRYLKKHPAPFYPGTFMYYEMEILEWLCRRDGSVVRYDPSITVLHHQNVATKLRFNSILKQSQFVASCLLDSLHAAEELILRTEREEAAAAPAVKPPALAASVQTI